MLNICLLWQDIYLGVVSWRAMQNLLRNMARSWYHRGDMIFFVRHHSKGVNGLP